MILKKMYKNKIINVYILNDIILVNRYKDKNKICKYR